MLLRFLFLFGIYNGGLCVFGTNKGNAFHLVWLSESTLNNNFKFKRDEHSVLYNLFCGERDRRRNFKLVALALVARRIAYALTSGDMNNLNKTPGIKATGEAYGGLIFSNFVRFARLVDCICEFEEVEVYV